MYGRHLYVDSMRLSDEARFEGVTHSTKSNMQTYHSQLAETVFYFTGLVAALFTVKAQLVLSLFSFKVRLECPSMI